MSIIRLDLTGSLRPDNRHLVCIRTTGGLTVLGEMPDPVAALLYGKAEVLDRVASGVFRDLISVEVLNSQGEIVLGEMAEDLVDSDVSAFAVLRGHERNL